MEPMELFRQAAGAPLRVLEQWTAAHRGPAVGFVCSYVPEEIIWAAGGLPFRLLGLRPATELADRHIQSYCCSPVRSILEDGLSGSLEQLAGTAFAAGCDSMQRLSDIWGLSMAGGFKLDLELPSKLNTQASREYMAHVLRRFHAELSEALEVPAYPQALRRSITLFNELRSRLRRLARQRREQPGCLSGGDFLSVCLASQLMDRAEASARLGEMLEKLDRPPCEVRAQGPGLVVSGSPCIQPRMMRLIEDCSAWVAADDLCTGERAFQGHVDEAADPYEALAGRLAARPPCPAKHAGLEARVDFLRRQVEDSGASGVILSPLAFCDPHGFDRPRLEEALREAGTPCITCELDEQRLAEEQIRTRCRAFVETLS